MTNDFRSVMTQSGVLGTLLLVCDLANYLTHIITCVLTASFVIKLTCIVKNRMLLPYR